MKAVYGGMTLSPGPFTGDATWLTSFSIKGEQKVQMRSPMRAAYAKPKARGLRVHTIEIVFVPPPSADLDASFALLSSYFALLPLEGDLVLNEGASQRTFSDAVIKDFSPPPRTGISNRFPLLFVAGACSAVTLSPLAQMDPKNVWNKRTISGLTGGGDANLDGFITSDVAVGASMYIYPVLNGVAQPRIMSLITDPSPGVTVTNADPDAGTLIVLPLDYDATTNPKIWTE
jgi:hypothetical protein